MKVDLDRAVEEAYPETLRLRRDIHKHPELAFQEERTASLVAEGLKTLGLEVTTGVSRTRVVGLLNGGREGKTLLIRADLDGLPITEVAEVDYHSRSDGVMHA